MDVIYNEDCLAVLKRLGDNSIDAIITDPPYNLGFMSKKWDGTGIAFNVELWKECLRVIKPGGNLLAFGGTRTHHRMICAIEDAGFEIRDCIMWVYGSGFPKSLSIGKQIDKKAGLHSPVLVPTKTGNTKHDRGVTYATDTHAGFRDISEPATPEAKLWEGYGTALKPAYEPIVLAMKPLDGTFADNCLKWGVGGLNIDECRIQGDNWTRLGLSYDMRSGNYGTGSKKRILLKNGIRQSHTKGRFPANFIHDGSQDVMELFPDTKSGARNKSQKSGFQTSYVGGKANNFSNECQASSGSAARFFYCAKSSRQERDMGCEDLPLVRGFGKNTSKQIRRKNPDTGEEKWFDYKPDEHYRYRNNHPTVKPLALMEYLVKLVTRPDHIVLDPFLGSGTTAMACKKLGRYYIGCELDKDYYDIAVKRISAIQ